MRLQNRTALITGGNSGIGLATARAFVAEGARVAITGRNRATLDAALAELGAGALAIQADATDIAATERAVAEVAQAFGRIDILFANAGIVGATPLGAGRLEVFEQVLRTNVTAVFFTLQAALPHLSDGASVILNGSVMSQMGSPGSSAYAASKAAVRGMSRVLASELAPRGIRVNVVSPGATRTPIWDSAAPTADAKTQLEKRLAGMIALGRLGEAEEIAKTAVFLASGDASNITSAEIFVDGGTNGSPVGGPVFRG
ncbi:SDR family oxidoreductase [Ferrovibrio sp.]|uniref:SDR family oxidoreductase n=1 Tax=Ferrovibrio sp. TaxID=1917215 RepID=UPI00311D6A07